MDARPDAGAARVLVHLTDVPVAKRRSAARRIIRLERLDGTPALALLVAAEKPRRDPWLLVTAAQARAAGVRLAV